MHGQPDSEEAIHRVDNLLAIVGLVHGSRQTLAGTWQGGQRKKLRRSANGVASSRPAPKPMVVRASGWSDYRWLRHGFTTRFGGVSDVYGPRELNLGWTASDHPANVAENRRLLLNEIAGAKSTGRLAPPLVTLRQVHSGVVRIIEKNSGALDGMLQTAGGKAILRGDAMMTDVPGLLLGIQVADCVPVLVADVKRRAVAAFHAGWRGTLQRIVERGIGRMRLRYGSRPEDLIAAIGPSIGPCCYSVGEEVRHEFDSQFAYAPDLFTEVFDSDPVKEKYPLLFLTARAPGHSNIGPQTHLNLWQANRRQLLDAGLSAGRISLIGECTACTRTTDGRLKYFSHRGEAGFAGRMMGVIGVTSIGPLSVADRHKPR